MTKQLEDMTFEEVRTQAVEIALNAVVTGKKLSEWVWEAVELGARWRQLKSDADEFAAGRAIEQYRLTIQKLKSRLDLIHERTSNFHSDDEATRLLVQSINDIATITAGKE